MDDKIKLTAKFTAPPDPEALRGRRDRRRGARAVKPNDQAAIRKREVEAHCKLICRQVEALKKHGIRHENEVAALATSLRGLPEGIELPKVVRDYLADYLEAAVEWHFSGSKRKRPEPTKAQREARARLAAVVFWRGGRRESRSFLDIMSDSAVVDLLQKFGLEKNRERAYKEVAEQLGITASQVRTRYYRIKGRKFSHR